MTHLFTSFQRLQNQGDEVRRLSEHCRRQEGTHVTEQPLLKKNGWDMMHTKVSVTLFTFAICSCKRWHQKFAPVIKSHLSQSQSRRKHWKVRKSFPDSYFIVFWWICHRDLFYHFNCTCFLRKQKALLDTKVLHTRYFWGCLPVYPSLPKECS